ncbi:dTMP kinase [Pseudomonas yamanorum]|uniref:Thymidylate kinase n=1 Tax=Pseudomonas yamanorum TaxID=515393 RepID=A0A7Y8K6W0_9PSED|nr:dTMP kinase [Pseudomonas yamanorum]
MFIVIEGIDGTGKATQTALLKDYFESKGNIVDTYDFPAYESFVGQELGKLLSGENEVNASTLPGKIMAMLFSLDRMQFLEQIRSSLTKNNLVISNRYSLSNAAFQSIRCGYDISEWVYELEYSALKLPKPDLYIILKGSVESSNKNVEKKKQRIYTDSHDLYESDNRLLHDAQEMYCSLSTAGVPRVIIDCLKDGNLRAREEIREEMIKHIESLSLSLSELITKSDIRRHVNSMITNSSLELEIIKNQVAKLPQDQIQALELLSDKFKESELGKKIGIISNCHSAETTVKVSKYLFACVAAKIYISMMIETNKSIKNHAIDAFCRELQCNSDCIVPMDRYSREVLGE